MGCKNKSKNVLSDLSLEIGIKNAERYIEEEIIEEKYKKSIEQIMELFQVVINFCDKEYKMMKNGFSGIEAFNIFVSAIESNGVEVTDTLEVKEQAQQYYNILKQIRQNKHIEKEKRKQIIQILNKLNYHLDNVTNYLGENNQWRF